MSTFDLAGVKVASSLVDRPLDLAHVRVDESGLWVDEALALARADIASVTVELDERTGVFVRNRDGKGVSCAFTSPDDARALLEALGRSPERTMLEVPLVPSLLDAGFGSKPWWRGYLAAGGAIAAWLVALLLLLGRAGYLNPFAGRASLPELPGWAGAVVIAAVLTVIMVLTRSPRALSQTMELGADGVRLRGFANDFVAHDEIRSVSSREERLVLTLRDGREVTSAVKVPSRMPEIVARIQRALDEKASPVDENVVARLRVPGGKHERVAALRELAADEDASYREARIPREHLWALVEAPQVDGATRSRAAVALSANLAGEDRERLRQAINATASPRVRIALDAIEHGDEATLAERLDDLEEVDEEARLARKAR